MKQCFNQLISSLLTRSESIYLLSDATLPEDKHEQWRGRVITVCQSAQSADV